MHNSPFGCARIWNMLLTWRDPSSITPLLRRPSWSVWNCRFYPYFFWFLSYSLLVCKSSPQCSLLCLHAVAWVCPMHIRAAARIKPVTLRPRSGRITTTHYEDAWTTRAIRHSPGKKIHPTPPDIGPWLEGEIGGKCSNSAKGLCRGCDDRKKIRKYGRTSLRPSYRGPTVNTIPIATPTDIPNRRVWSLSSVLAGNGAIF